MLPCNTVLYCSVVGGVGMAGFAQRGSWILESEGLHITQGFRYQRELHFSSNSHHCIDLASRFPGLFEQERSERGSVEAQQQTRIVTVTEAHETF